MLYAIPDILFKLELNTNNTGDQVIHYTWNIVESGVNDQ
jgi:hypothetical protein